jgi:hypothetical protein
MLEVLREEGHVELVQHPKGGHGCEEKTPHRRKLYATAKKPISLAVSARWDQGRMSKHCGKSLLPE